MAVRLHRTRDPLPSLEPKPKKKSEADPPTAPSLPPQVNLSLRKPIEMESPLRRVWKPALIGFGVALLALFLWSLRPERVVVTATPIVEKTDVLASVAGTLEWIAPAGETIAPGAEIARIVPPVASGDIPKLEAALSRAERLLADARREKSRVDDLFRNERATRRERYDVNGFVRLRQDERDAAKAKLEAAKAAAKPVVSSVSLVNGGRVVDPIAAGTVVAQGDRLASLAPEKTRLTFEADEIEPGAELQTIEGAAIRVVSVDGRAITAEMDGEITSPVSIRIR